MFDRSPEARQRTIERHRQRSLKRSAQIAEFAVYADELMDMSVEESGIKVVKIDDNPETKLQGPADWH